MVMRITRIAALPALVAMLSAVVACTGPESTPTPEPSDAVSSPAPPSTPAPEESAATGSAATPVREVGYAMYCAGLRSDGNRVVVELYTNSTVEVPAGVVVLEAGEDGERILITSKAAQPPTITDQEVSADVPLLDAATGADAGTAQVRGTIEPTGWVRQIDDDFEDAGERIRTTGTNEDLRADVGVQIGEEAIDLECGEAFRYDLQVTKTPIN